jgi:hypothetical protein
MYFLYRLIKSANIKNEFLFLLSVDVTDRHPKTMARGARTAENFD